jgi:hypothetical protein
MIDENFIYFFKLAIGSKNIGLNPNLKTFFASSETPISVIKKSFSTQRKT